MCPNIRYAQFLNANVSGFRNAAFAPLVGVGEGGTNGSLNGRCLSVELQRTENAVAKKRYNVSFFRFLAFFGRSLLFGNAGAQATFVLLSRSPLSSVALMMFGISYPCHLNPANAVLQLHEEDAGRSTVCQKSRADLRCIQCHVNSWTLDAPKVSGKFLRSIENLTASLNPIQLNSLFLTFYPQSVPPPLPIYLSSPFFFLCSAQLRV